MKPFPTLAIALSAGLLVSCFSTTPTGNPGVSCLDYLSSALNLTFRDSASGTKLRMKAFSVVTPESDTLRLDTSRIVGEIQIGQDTVYTAYGSPGVYKVLVPTSSGIRTSSYTVPPKPGEPLECGHTISQNVEIRLSH